MVEAEVVVISEEQQDMVIVDEEEEQRAGGGLSKLESFKFLRVLLVEFDDSTRFIISALLRKSGYRVVSVPDGLKAWETLKGKPQNIDLVLAEVELPSISGFSLLSMIMEDNYCRNIPVIMMSPHDAVGIVFKCMLKGAADFLVKPVRKNELRNLWQHVWRRNSVNNVANSQPKTEPIDETSSTKNSTHSAASRDEITKGCDAQSSCTKPDMEDDKLTRLNSEVEPCNRSNCSVPLHPEENHAVTTQREDPSPEIQQEGTNLLIDIPCENDKRSEPSREAMDLIGSFDNNVKACNGHFQQVVPTNSNIFLDPSSTRKACSSTPRLELSLRGSDFSDNEIQGVAENQTLKHSNASAFSRYNNSTLQSPACTESKECASNSCKDQSEDHALGHMAEVPQQGAISVPLPVGGTYSGYGALWPQLFYTPVGPLPLPNSISSTQQQEVITDQSDYQQHNYESTDTTMPKQRHYVESFDHARQYSAATTKCATSSLCNSSSSNINSSGCGSVCDGSNGDEAAVTTFGATTGSGNDLGFIMPDVSNCCSQREVALIKFRLKRKDRCFDKKVRYQSRKKLAEQRPRVKGQFVRQIQS